MLSSFPPRHRCAYLRGPCSLIIRVDLARVPGFTMGTQQFSRKVKHGGSPTMTYGSSIQESMTT